MTDQDDTRQPDNATSQSDGGTLEQGAFKPRESPHEAPTHVRFDVIGVTTLTALILYLDRICIAEIAKLDEFKNVLNLTETQTGAILSAFFFSYALGQVPAGWLSDRFGARRMMPLYICIWSLCTILTGLANGFVMLIAARLLFGVAQAGCYPTAGSLIKRWTALAKRGTASAVVSFGGRFGGAIAPILTAWLLKDYLGWRSVLALYGVSGFCVAAGFWKVFRETPAEHPHCNTAEQNLISHGDVESADTGPPPLPPILPLIRSGTMWLMCALQFGINVGWVFLVTWLPTYPKDVRHVSPKIGGLMSTIVLAAGVAGMLCGGPLTDVSVRHLGRRWGRSLPLVGCYAVAVASYLSCLYLDSAWAFIAAASVVAFVTDMSVPGIWAYMQDVGGKNTAAVFGWGNMWGNLGAATTPLLVPIVLEQWDTNHDWHEAFLLFSAGYVIAMMAALGINADRKVQ
jgi:ACS family glucarate transporter-like MFS transporter